jgi:anti-anti-sigma regulatory factor
MINHFEVKKMKKFIIFDAKAAKFSVEDFDFLLLSIKKCKISKNIIINMNNVSCISNDFVSYFIELSSISSDLEICFCSLDPVINSLFYIFNLDKYFELYINEQDAQDKLKPLVKRRLKLVS